MDLKTLLGAAYKEGMTLEEVDAALADRDLMDKSEAEKLANNRTAATKRLLDAANAKLAEANKHGEATGADLATALARIEVLENENKTAKRNESIAATKASLIAQGYDDALANETAIAMADGDMAKILENQGKFLTSKTQAMKDELLKGTQPPAGGGSGAGVDYTAAKNKALADGNDLEYLRLCREETELNQQK